MASPLLSHPPCHLQALMDAWQPAKASLEQPLSQAVLQGAGLQRRTQKQVRLLPWGHGLQRSQGLLGCVNGVPWSLQEHACRWKRRASQKPHLLQKACRRPAPAAMPPSPRQLLCLAEDMSHGPSGWSCLSSLKQQPPVSAEGLLLFPQCFNIVHVHQGALEAIIFCLAFDICTTDAERGRIALYPS